MAERTYTYAQVADLIEQVFGVRPSLSMLRAEPAEARRRPGTEIRPRLSAGLPAPMAGPGRPAPASFDAAAIDAWLALRLSEEKQRFERKLVVLKSRGMAHSNAVRDFVISDTGFSLREDGVGAD